jgi:hypothetical protein
MDGLLSILAASFLDAPVVLRRRLEEIERGLGTRGTLLGKIVSEISGLGIDPRVWPAGIEVSLLVADEADVT